MVPLIERIRVSLRVLCVWCDEMRAAGDADLASVFDDR